MFYKWHRTVYNLWFWLVWLSIILRAGVCCELRGCFPYTLSSALSARPRLCHPWPQDKELFWLISEQGSDHCATGLGEHKLCLHQVPLLCLEATLKPSLHSGTINHVPVTPGTHE